MKYILDTNTCIYIIKKKPKEVLERLSRVNVHDIGISSITLSELEYGVEKSSNPQRNRITLFEFISGFEIFRYDESAAREYGIVRAALEKRGTPIGSMDMLIAAHAKALQVILVTNNVREFSRVHGLMIENWVDNA
ncbi:MAG: type II toxin-antitoxin system VapC family toxin [Ignavibacteriae bacterium]|nr:type II toxin-antitoxin system VapC family toxin [Ignavibacteriota bacterium]